MRGRLIIPFLAELAQLDTDATAQADGYDDVLKEPIPSYPNGADGAREDGRKERILRLRCQIEPATSDAQSESDGGDLPRYRYVLAFHAKDLEKAGLIDDNGAARIRNNDRLKAIYTMRGRLERAFVDPKLYATEVQEREYGLGRRRNIVIVTFVDRPQGARGGGGGG
jgi:hypothetical protein